MRWPTRKPRAELVPAADASAPAPVTEHHPGPSLRGDREAALWLLRNTNVPTHVVLAHYLDGVPR
jgi:hypothetical protein